MSEPARLSMSDAALLRGIAAMLQTLIAETRELRALVERIPAAPAPDPRIGAFLRALDKHWGNQPFKAGELLAWCAAATFPGRQEVRAALDALCGSPAGAHVLGLRLRAVAGVEVGGLKLQRVAATEGGARLWCVARDGTSPNPPAPVAVRS